MNITPEKHGVSSLWIKNMISEWNNKGFAMHSVLLARKGEIFYEGYWAPYNDRTLHRMNSVTKSFVGIAIGLLIEEGKLSLTDKLTDLMPDKLPTELQPELELVTLRDMLMMRTATTPVGHWVRDKVKDRAGEYFTTPVTHPKDTLFFYDSPASFLLTKIVEDRVGMPFTEYLKKKALLQIGFSENAYCIKGNDGYSWGDSGLLCTTKDVFLFAELLRRGGNWYGKQLIDADYVREATSFMTSTPGTGWESHCTHGYGYQIWKTEDGGFAFFGMGDQLMLCYPDKELIFVCTADNQGCSFSREMIMDSLRRNILSNISSSPIAENADDLAELEEFTRSLKLVALRNKTTDCIADEINGRKIVFDQNPMGIKWATFRFCDGSGCMDYENATGQKKIEFLFDDNKLSHFPEEGYPDDDMREFTPGNYYPSATSAAWLDSKTLAIKSFMIGKHLGALYITVGFRNDGVVGMRMLKNTNCFLATYNGYAGGHFAK